MRLTRQQIDKRLDQHRALAASGFARRKANSALLRNVKSRIAELSRMVPKVFQKKATGQSLPKKRP